MISSLVRKAAPDFCAPAVMPDGIINEKFSLSGLEGKYRLLFFWPFDFSGVCPTEIWAHNDYFDQFKERGVELIGISIDSHFVHSNWRSLPREQGGLGEVKFPLVSDVDRAIIQSYGIEADGVGCALRASFLIDKSGIVRHQTVNDLQIARDVAETLRLVDALQFVDQNGEACPAGWHKGDPGIK